VEKAFQKISKGKAWKIIGGDIMISRKSVILLFVTAACISSILLVCFSAWRSDAVNSQSSRKQVQAGQSVRLGHHKPERFGKIKVPADVSLDLASSSKPDGPVTILVSVSSQIAVHSGTLMLKVPQTGEAPAETQVLWSGMPSDFVAETVEFVLDVLPEGKYHFGAIFEFTPDSENAGELFTSKSLYLDVRPDKILSSNVSFEQIKRVELWNELEQRVLMDLKQDSRAASLKAVARDMRSAETLNHELIASRIAELKASDLDVARRIMELNRVKAAPTAGTEQSEKTESDTKRRRLRNRPLSERAVPVPEKFRDR
jgi:hypothetical protein